MNAEIFLLMNADSAFNFEIRHTALEFFYCTLATCNRLGFNTHSHSNTLSGKKKWKISVNDDYAYFPLINFTY